MLFLTLDNYLRRITPQQVPGVACWVGTATRTLFSTCYGLVQREPSRVKIRQDTLFDLASLTKPLATAVAAIMCVEQGMFRLQDPIARFLSGFKDTPHRNTTIAHLLTHTSGLPAWFPLYILPERARMSYLAHARVATSQVVYSCLGYILLGKIIEHVTGQHLDAFCVKRIYRPAGIDCLFFKPRSRRNCAATEKGDAYEQAMTAEFCDPSVHRWRSRVIRGEAHDGNCHYAFRGCAGNAGLFGTVQGCARFLQSYSRGSIVGKKHVALMTRDHTGGPEKRGLGWWIDPYPGLLSKHTYAHTGFTGTMVCVDPVCDIMIVLLTNAIHPHVRQEIKRKIRRKVVAIVAETLLR